MRVAKNRRDTSVPPTMSKPIGKVTHSPSLAESTVSSMTSSAAVLISDWGFPGYLSADEFTAFVSFLEIGRVHWVCDVR